jgi:hypothetical protein
VVVSFVSPQPENIVHGVATVVPRAALYSSQLADNFRQRTIVQQLEVINVELLKNPSAIFFAHPLATAMNPQRPVEVVRPGR